MESGRRISPATRLCAKDGIPQIDNRKPLAKFRITRRREVFATPIRRSDAGNVQSIRFTPVGLCQSPRRVAIPLLHLAGLYSVAASRRLALLHLGVLYSVAAPRHNVPEMDPVRCS
jgi:hypothetical protein